MRAGQKYGDSTGTAEIAASHRTRAQVIKTTRTEPAKT
jgi:hypothetical protein